ncbi:FKBP-type peptidyl-prolyl cis-trans isomerase [Spirillospora sp. CA-294931]|uniref:FKBP-type peptidyl-prolyl cis-trans isomerase n=1 Tax=Spirillospora sp. CA-294931 TaxID=3240042 RepID=UPI003D8BCC47
MAEDDKPRGKPEVKAKLPSAKNIRSPEFTPHGINSGRGNLGSASTRPSGLTAAKAKKRRIIWISVVTVVVVAVAGTVVWYSNWSGPKVSVSGKFGDEPKVSISKFRKKPTKMTITNQVKGKGATLETGDMAFVKFAFYKWAKGKGKPVGSSYKQSKQPVTIPVGGDSGVKGLDKALPGHKVGDRFVAELPPKDGFGKEAAQVKLSEKDTVVFVVDVMSAVSAGTPAGTMKKLDDKNLPTVEDAGARKAPKVTIPKVDAPDSLKIETLIEGKGPAVKKGESAFVNYQGQIWKTGKEFDSTWTKKKITTFGIGTGQTIPGFDKGLTGAKVGSRIMLVIPPKDGYGKNGQPQAGIKGDDTLVFVIDILGIAPAQPAPGQ